MSGIAILLGICAVIGLGVWATHTITTWVSEQPPYQIPFGAVLLDPPPPVWYRGGSTAFLEDVRRRASMPATISMLKITKEELKGVFQRSPWIEEVEQVIDRPLGLTIRLKYLVPVAIVETSGGKKYPVDGSAIILPDDVIDQAQLGQDRLIIGIKGERLLDPRNAQPGLPWKPRPGAADVAPGNDQIPSAAKLAQFLAERLRSIDRTSHPALNILYINPMDVDSRGLFLWNAESTYILWGGAPGQEQPGELSAEKKWENLRVWSESETKRTIPEGHFWKITAAGLVHKVFDRPAPRSTGTNRPRSDRSAVRTKDSGQTP
jgi:hypothetical protein